MENHSDPPEDLPIESYAAGTDCRTGPSLTAAERSTPMTQQVHMVEENVSSTEDLVKALNAAQSDEEGESLREWVWAYIEWFKRQEVGALNPAEMQEYSYLAHVEASTEGNKELLRIYFNRLCNGIDREYRHGEECLILALEYTLQNLDNRVVERNPHSLFQLGDKLLEKLGPTNHFSKETYPTHRSLLYALHQTMVLIREVTLSQLNLRQKDRLYNGFKARIQAIAESAQYYPVCFHARLLEQSLQRLSLVGKCERIEDGLMRTFRGLEGAYNLYKGLKALTTLDIDLEAFRACYEGFKAAGESELVEEGQWYDWLQSMNYACLLSLEDAAQYSVFEKRLKEVEAKEASMFKADERKALHYGIVQQLSLLVLSGATAEVRKGSMEKLSSLAESCKIPEGKRWLDDVEVLDALLEGLVTIAVQSHDQEKDDAEAALEILTDPEVTTSKRFLFWGDKRKAAMKRTIIEWLGGHPLNEKLSALRARDAGPVSGGLFGKIYKELRGAMPEEVPPSAGLTQDMCQALKDFYQRSSFAGVKSLLDNEQTKHVGSLQCQLMLIEEVQIKPAHENNGDGDQESSQSTEGKDSPIHYEQVKTPIALEDLFRHRSTKPDEAEREIHRVLLVGNPGTGKTTLSRKLAYSWAQGTWGQEFGAVYVLAVRTLQQSVYDDTTFRRQGTLANAIAKSCFDPVEDDRCLEQLRQQINQELAKSTTLVVLDGLDEQYGANEYLLNKAMGGKHKLLMLTRPYGIGAERPLADIEVEHVGLNDEQMQVFVHKELSHDLGKELLSFVQKRAIGTMAHVPVNLQILCGLWKHNASGVRAATEQGSMPGLYEMLASFIWDRYKGKENQNRDEDREDQDCEAVFSALGQIAAQGLKKEGQLISEVLIKDVLQNVGTRVRKMVKDVGFLLFQSAGKQYEFPHLTFQEYFAGRWRARQFLLGSEEEHRDAKKFLSIHKYDSQYAMTLSFMAGEVSRLKGISGIRRILELVEEDPREVVGVQHVLLQLRLLHEFLCKVEEGAGADLAELEGKFHMVGSLKQWFQEGLERVRQGGHRGDPCNLLSLLTTGIQASRSVAVHGSSLRVPLLSASKDGDIHVRIAALQALSFVFAVAPVEVPSLLDHLIKSCKDENKYVRTTARDALRKLFQVAPQQATTTLINTYKNEDPGIRRATIEGISCASMVVPNETSSFRETMIIACKDRDSGVRIAALEGLGTGFTILPGEVAALQAPILNACMDSDSGVRIVALEAFSRVFANASETASSHQEVLLKACKDENKDVCAAAHKALSRMLAVKPEEPQSQPEPVLDTSENEEVLSRMAERMALGKVFSAASGETPSVSEAKLDFCKDANVLFHIAAQEAIKDVFPDMPETATARELLLAACEDEVQAVRIAAISGLAREFAAFPEKTPELLNHISNICEDGNSAVGIVAVSSLGKMIVGIPGEASTLLEHLVDTCEDRDTHIRHAAIVTLVKVAPAVPEEAPVLLELVINACKDGDNDIRRTAREALSTFVKAVPGEAPALVEGLMKASRDSWWTLRRAALAALENVLTVAPGESPRLVKLLLNACKDSAYRVRRAALEVLLKVVENAPREAQAPGFREQLISACLDSRAFVRTAALGALKIFSAKQLIEDYWDTKDKACIPAIVARLYHDPLIVQAACDLHPQEVELLLSEGRAIPGTKPRNEVDLFVQEIKREARKSVPDMKNGLCIFQ